MTLDLDRIEERARASAHFDRVEVMGRLRIVERGDRRALASLAPARREEEEE